MSWEHGRLARMEHRGPAAHCGRDARAPRGSASCPAGPAFEGGQVTYGMPGYDGAVESVTIGVAAESLGGGDLIVGSPQPVLPVDTCSLRLDV